MKISTLMISRKLVCIAGAVALVADAGRLSAEMLNPRTAPQIGPMSRQEKKNLDMVLECWRKVVYAGHVELAPKYIAENLVEHSPNISTGRAGFVEYISKMHQPVSPIPAELEHPPVVMAAKGDYVWLIFENEETDLRDPSKSYYSDVMQLVRVENGKIQEHWDSQRKTPGAGAVAAGVSPKPAMQWNTGQLSPEEEQSLKLATAEFRDMLQRAHLEMAPTILDAGYIQHNPHFPQGRDGLVQVMSRRPGRRPEDAKPIGPEWLDPPFITLVNGPYSMMVWERKAKDPDNASKEYTFYHYDLVRVDHGLIKEHWDEFVGATAP
jgi:predicted SnoaL-like aldol condensation-catalyzing enzyme